MELSFKQKLFYFFPVLFCFCLPFGSLILSALIIAWTVISLLNINPQKIKEGLLNRNLWLMYLFFFLTLVSAFTSSNKQEASSSIEIKLSFILFPYLLFCFSWPIDLLKRCLASFVSGCFFACLYLIARATVFAFNGQPEYFFYTLFSDFIHASYFAMYLILAIAIVILFYKNWYSGQKNILYSAYFFVSVFVATIFLCSSKLGMISFFICLPLIILFQWRATLSLKRIFILAGVVLILLVAAVKIFPHAFERFNLLTGMSLQTIDKTSSESTTVRILIWEQAVQIIKHNFVTGTGVGDANDQLYAAYKENGLTGAFEHKFNAHNQFLQTFIGLGVIGFILLLMLTLGQFIKALRTKNFMLFLFSLLILLNFMVESMLQTAAGVLFFAFFFCLFNLTDQKKLSGV